MLGKRAKAVAGVVLLVVTAGMAVAPASAAGPVVRPPVVYTPVHTGGAYTPLAFDGSEDEYNGEIRLIEVPDDAEEECDHGEFPDDGVPGPGPDDGTTWFTGGCVTIQFEVDHGKIDIPGSDPANDDFSVDGGAEIFSGEFPANVANIFGSIEEINLALEAMTFTPDEDFESTLDAFHTSIFFHSSLLMFIDDGRGNPLTASDGADPVEVGIRIEQPNDGPEIENTVAPQPVPVAAGDEVNWTDQVELVDPDVNSPSTEPDDVVLVIVWTDGEGLIDLGGFASPSCLASPTDLLTVGFCPSFPYSVLGAVVPDDLIDGVIESIELLFPGGALDGPFADEDDGDSLDTPSEAFAFLADSGDDGDDGDGDDGNVADNILDSVTYHAPDTGDHDVELFIAVTDIGNNGLPFGPGPSPFLPLPDLGFAITSWDIEVRDIPNDPPVITGPSDLPATEAVAAVVGDFTVTDPDLGAGLMDVTISVDAGEGALSSMGGTGLTLADVNTLLDGLTFTPAPDADTDDETDIPVTITVDDNGNTGTGGEMSDSHTVLVDVTDDDEPPPDANDPPVVAGPAGLAATEAVVVDVGDFTVTDPDVGAGLMDVTISVTAGEGSLSSSGGTNLTLAEVNALLDGLTFTPAADADTDDETDIPIDITVDDNGNTGTGGEMSDSHTVLVDVTDDDEPPPDANDPPVIAGPAGLAATEAVEVVVGDFTVTDPDVGAGLMDVTVSVPAGEGTLSSTGDTGLTLAEVNALLDGLSFTPAPDADTDDEIDVPIDITVDDNGNTGTGGEMSDSHTVLVDVTDDDEPPPDPNDPPVITGPADLAAVEAVAVDVGDFTVTDPDVGAGVMDVTISVTAGEGALSSNGGTGLTLAEVNTLLDDLTFTPAPDADTVDEIDVPIEITVDDNGNTGTGGEMSDTHTVLVDVTDDDPPPDANDPPVIAGPAGLAATEAVEVVVGDFTVTDPDVGAGLMDVSISVDAGEGSLSSPGGTGLTLAEVNSLLDGLTFTAADDADLDDETDVPITITVDDNGNTGTGGEMSDSHTVLVDVTDDDDAPDANDPPAISGPSDLVATEAVEVGVGDFTVTDPDVGAGLMDVSISVTAGEGSLSSSGGTNLTLAEVNALLDGLTFTPADDADFDDETDVPIDITVDDNGNTGTGGEMSDSHTVLVDVDDDDSDPGPGVNDPPTLTVPGAQSIVEGGQIVFTGPLTITVADPDAGSGDLFMRVTVTGPGDVTLAAVADTNGTLAELQAVLDALVFTAGAPGTATITIMVDDQGNTGTGGPQTVTATIVITVTAAGPPPTTPPTTPPGGGGTGGTGSGSLPTTGSDLPVLVGLGFVLAATGALLLGGRRLVTASRWRPGVIQPKHLSKGTGRRRLS